MTEAKADLGLIGLAVMGQNLVLNMSDHGYRVSVFNRTTAKVTEFLSGPGQGTQIIGTYSLKELIASLKKPRKLLFMVKAGNPVDELIDECLPFLEPGDILIDGGNSHYPDTKRRVDFLKKKEILFIGAGISGGEEGARNGPSIMPGGNKEAWPILKQIFQNISAKAQEDGLPCCEWIGEGGAGHYVKMVHNGIEYGDMQLIAEAYFLLKTFISNDPKQLHDIFSEWNLGYLNSFLIEITAKIFLQKEKDGTLLLDHVLDVANQKGTGKWTGISALDLGVPVSLITEAVYARCLSSLKEERLQAQKIFPQATNSYTGTKKQLILDIKQALYASKIISYAQGFMLMRAAAKEMKWDLNYGSIALIWRAGCIIRSGFLNDIKKAYDVNADLPCLLFDDFFKKAIINAEVSWRKVIITAVQAGVPVPCFSSALSFFDGYRSGYLPANLIQAQRDFFGAHTYERTDRPRGQFFHTDWNKMDKTSNQ
ncbi:MAG: decarboxylating NADP(+)-dependent phosphogluconate dehydrogenase [Candidatus Rhabdochlamydia sp.]